MAVLDPLGVGWPGEYCTANKDKFMAYAKDRDNAGLMIFVDESGAVLNRYQQESWWLATQGRHWGHSCTFIGQRATQIPVTMRDQCITVYLFAISRDDAIEIARDWNCDMLVTASQLPKGAFYRVSRFAPLMRGQVDFAHKTVRLWKPDAKPLAIAGAQLSA